MSEQEIRRLGDVLQLQMVKATYCDIVDTCVQDADKAAERLTHIFTEDVRADYGVDTLRGRNAVINFLVVNIAANNESLWHSLHTPKIDVNGDVATAHWTVMVRMRQKGAATFASLYGRYRDEFRRTPQGWRISAIRFTQES